MLNEMLEQEQKTIQITILEECPDLDMFDQAWDKYCQSLPQPAFITLPFDAEDPKLEYGEALSIGSVLPKIGSVVNAEYELMNDKILITLDLELNDPDLYKRVMDLDILRWELCSIRQYAELNGAPVFIENHKTIIGPTLTLPQGYADIAEFGPMGLVRMDERLANELYDLPNTSFYDPVNFQCCLLFVPTEEQDKEGFEIIKLPAVCWGLASVFTDIQEDFESRTGEGLELLHLLDVIATAEGSDVRPFKPLRQVFLREEVEAFEESKI